MPIDTNEFTSDKEIFYTERYKTLVRSQKEVLLKHCIQTPLIEETIKHAYKNDFYRLLRHYKIPTHMRWTVAFLNNVTDPFQDITKMTDFLQIDENVLFELLARTNTTRD